jgi:molybdate transport system permease protein
MRIARRAFVPALVVALAAVLTFLVLPVAAVFLDIPPGRLLSELRSDVALDALRVTVKTNLIANALILGFGTPAAYLLATRRFRGRPLVVTLVELPLVLPPAVAGIGLIAAFGSLGLIGSRIEPLGVQVGTQTAVVMAITFVASPFYLRGAIAAFEAVDRGLLDAARTLGASPARVFFRVALPLAAGGLGAGAALAFARGLGEFGATIMFAGSLQGVTQTFSLAIYEQFDVAFDVALAISAFLIVVSGALLLAVKLVPAWARSSASTSPLGFARSSSS